MATVRFVSALYRGTFPNGTEQVDLRVDIEGDSSDTHRLSGDIFEVEGSRRAFSSSFIVDLPTPAAGPSQLICEGPARFSANPPRAARVRVIIPTIPAMPEPQFVTLRFITNGTVGPSIRCDRISPFWRRIELRQFAESGLIPFSSYTVGGRTLDIPGVFRSAGIDIDTEAQPTRLGTAGKVWTDAELHAAMESSLPDFADKTRWRAWLFHAGLYEKSTALGMMFDQKGRERQGCAVFYNMVGGDLRQQLHTCVHELGHCFNLYHTFTASPIPPRLPIRPRSRSWMNYPWMFPGGTAAYWNNFQIRFDKDELLHLRHGFRNDVIMGGRPFEGNGGLRKRPVGEGSALELRLEGPGRVRYAEPVWVELRLSARDDRSKEVHACLHPQEGYVKITIRKDQEKKVIFEPLVRRCVKRETVTCQAPIYESVLLGYGKGGFYFSEPGVYDIEAEYRALDGSIVASNKLILRVSEPDGADRAVAKLWFGDEQGMLLAFRGSDALKAGNARLDEIILNHGDHPLASYASLVQGSNLAREFKLVGPQGTVELRPPKLERAQERLQPVVADFLSGRSRINNLTFSRAFRRLAEGQMEVGDRDGAKTTLTQLEGNLLERRNNVENVPFRDEVIAAIQSQATAILAKA